MNSTSNSKSIIKISNHTEAAKIMIAPAARNKKKRAFEEEEGSSGHPDYHGRVLKEAQKRSSAGRPADTDA